jgi:hypothetical protein
MTMLTKTKIALAAAVVLGSAPVALADGEFDPYLGNRYPAYNEPIAAQAPVALHRNGGLRSAPVALHRKGHLRRAPVALHRNGHLRSAPVSLQAPGFEAQTFGEPITYGAGHAPRAFYDQQQPGYPQSPPGGGF